MKSKPALSLQPCLHVAATPSAVFEENSRVPQKNLQVYTIFHVHARKYSCAHKDLRSQVFQAEKALPAWAVEGMEAKGLDDECPFYCPKDTCPKNSELLGNGTHGLAKQSKSRKHAENIRAKPGCTKITNPLRVLASDSLGNLRKFAPPMPSIFFRKALAPDDVGFCALIL
jgi:hypothetical protein